MLAGRAARDRARASRPTRPTGSRWSPRTRCAWSRSRTASDRAGGQPAVQRGGARPADLLNASRRAARARDGAGGGRRPACGRPGSTAYGVPSVKAAWWASVRRAGAVPRAVFWPVPNVDSGLVAWRRRPAGAAAGRAAVFAVCRRGVRPAAQDPARRPGGAGRFRPRGRAGAPRRRDRPAHARGATRRRAVRRARGRARRAPPRAPRGRRGRGAAPASPCGRRRRSTCSSRSAARDPTATTTSPPCSMPCRSTTKWATRRSRRRGPRGDGRRRGARRAATSRWTSATWPSGRGPAPRRPDRALEPVHLHIRKGIPVAGGMAGGSADAAAALVACDALWGTGLAGQSCSRSRPSSARTCRSRSSAGRRWAPAGASELDAGAGPRRLHWVLALAGDRAVDAGGLPRARPAAGRPASLPEPRVPDALMQALRRGDAEAVGARLAQRPAAGGLSLLPELEHTLEVGHRVRRARQRRVGVGADGRVPRARPEHALDLSRRAGRPAGRRRGAARARAGARRAGRRARAHAGRGLAVAQPGQPRGRPGRLRRPHPAGRRLASASTTGDRIGVVGRNGDGKSTLLRVLARPAGARRRPGHPQRRRCTVGMLAQADDARPGADRPARRRRRHGRPRVGRRRRASATCSPGCSAADAPGSAASTRRSARCPAASAAGSRSPRCSSATTTCVLLDEPTNHLDVEGIAWLARHLRARWPADVARSWSSPTTGGSSTRSASAPGRCTTASSTRTRAATPPTCWPGPSAQRQAAAARSAGRT